MKTSNYIITTYFILLFVGVLVLFVAAKFYQKNEGHLQAKEQKLEPFSVIVAEPGANFELRTAEYPRIVSIHQLPDSCIFPPLGIRNDTLFVFADTIKNKIQNREVRDIIYGKGIKSIIAKQQAYVNLQDFHITSNDTITMRLTNAKIDMFFQFTTNYTGVYFLQAQESVIYLNGAHLKNMDIDIDKSKIYAWNSTIGNLSGTLKNYSELQASAMKKISVEVDSTSQLNIHK